MVRSVKHQSERPGCDEITIVVPGHITSWKRPARNRNQKHMHTDPKDALFRDRVAHEAMIVMGSQDPIPKEYALELSALAVFQMPKRMTKIERALAERSLLLKRTRPDMENILKGAKDACSGIVYADDAQVAGYGRIYKVYGPRPRLEIRLTIIDEPSVAGLPDQPVFEQLLAGAA
jgi:Holliday junction resolvase RusA-like endonuclease